MVEVPDQIDIIKDDDGNFYLNVEFREELEEGEDTTIMIGKERSNSI